MTNEDKIRRAIEHLTFAREHIFPYVDDAKMQVIAGNISLALYNLLSINEKENENVQCSYCA